MEPNAQSVTTFAELMSRYGVAIVISAVVIILFIWITVKDRKAMKELTEKVTNPTTNLSEAVISKFTKVLIESISPCHPNAEEANKRDDIDREMHLMLKALLEHTSSDRAFIYLYHNGGKSYSGFSFNKMSCLSEAVVPGIKPVSRENQQIQRSSYTDMITALKEDGEFFVSSIDNSDIDPIIREWCARRAARACYLKSFKDHQGYVIGFLGIDYVATHDVPTEEKIRLKLNEAAVATTSLVLAGTYVKDFNADKVVTEDK